MQNTGENNPTVQEVKKHSRVNDILLGPLERPALLWLAARMPAWVTPDMLTGLGLAASGLIFLSYWLTNIDKGFLWLASFGFILNWFGDSLDGNLARYRKMERPRYGYFVDHVVDALSEVLVFLGIGLSPYVRFDLAALALIAYMLMSVLVYVTTYVNNVFRISYIRVGPTEMRVLAILANAFVFFSDNPLLPFPFNLGSGTFYDVVIAGIAILLFVVFVVTAAQQSVELNKQDRYEWMRARRPSRVKIKIRRARRSANRSVSSQD